MDVPDTRLYVVEEDEDHENFGRPTKDSGDRPFDDKHWIGKKRTEIDNMTKEKKILRNTIKIKIGFGQIIKAWDEGLRGLAVGEFVNIRAEP